MDYRLDLRTLTLVAGVVNLIICICMIYTFRKRKAYNGVTQWIIAFILNSFAWIFFSVKGFVPEFISIIMADTLIVIAAGLVAYGLECFAGGTRRAWLFISLAMFVFVSCSYFTFYSPNVNARVVIIYTILVILYAYCAYVLHCVIPRLINIHNMLLTTVFSFVAIWSVWRVFSAVFVESPLVDIRQSPIIQGITIIVLLGGNIFTVIGLILLNFQRVEIELLKSNEEIKILRGIIPICAACKKIRDDKGSWEQIEVYIQDHSDAEFSHGICPECVQKLYPEFAEDDEKG